MANHEIPLHEGLDPVASRFGFMPKIAVDWMRGRGILLNRDECRSPMQWDATEHGGFSSNEPWLPVHPNTNAINVAAQARDPKSLLWCYRDLLALRRRLPCLQAGSLEWLPNLTDDIVGYRRTLGQERADVFMNFASFASPLDLSAYPDHALFSIQKGIKRKVPARYILSAHEGIVVYPSTNAER